MKGAFKESPIQQGDMDAHLCPYKAEYYHRGLSPVPQESSYFIGSSGKAFFSLIWQLRWILKESMTLSEKKKIQRTVCARFRGLGVYALLRKQQVVLFGEIHFVRWSSKKLCGNSSEHLLCFLPAQTPFFWKRHPDFPLEKLRLPSFQLMQLEEGKFPYIVNFKHIT